MAAAKNPGGNAGKGRKPGVPNKVTADVKAMVLTALNKVGGAAYLARQAEKSPAAFMVLVGKVLPLQVTGAPGGEAIQIQIVRYAAEQPEPADEQTDSQR